MVAPVNVKKVDKKVSEEKAREMLAKVGLLEKEDYQIVLVGIGHNADFYTYLV